MLEEAYGRMGVCRCGGMVMGPVGRGARLTRGGEQAVTGTIHYVDNGMHAMGLSLDSSNFKEYIDKQVPPPHLASSPAVLAHPWCLCFCGSQSALALRGYREGV